MTTLFKIIITTVLSILATSCQFDINLGQGITGNRNVESEERNLTEDITQIKVSNGLDVYITQENNTNITVEADENLMDIIVTEIKNETLHIYAEKNIRRAKSKKVYVSLPKITKIRTSSGADVIAENIIKANELELKSSSGSDIRITVKANEVHCDTSSGSDIRISGTANTLIAEASSGSDIKAQNLETQKCIADASSGADIRVNVSEELIAEATSGADIKYSGNPESVSKNKSASGSVYKD